jgi:peptidoglycan/xylan/chitin deacetylase (PgdA/CDA1 family)
MVKGLFFKYGYVLRLHYLFKPWLNNKPVTVICLHRVNTQTDPLFPALRPETFNKLIRLLKKEYEITSFSEIGDGGNNHKSKRPFLVISFDDGYKDFMEFCLPVISKEKIPVNHNIVINSAETGQLIWTQRINNLVTSLAAQKKDLSVDLEGFSFNQKAGYDIFKVKRALTQLLFARPYSFIEKLLDLVEKKYSFEQPTGQMMNWNEIITCSREGVEIGSHTITHGSLAENHGKDYFKYEIEGSKRILEEKLQGPVKSFAFPNGLAHSLAFETAFNAGYTNLLLIDGVKYDFDLRPERINSYKRILVGRPSPYEEMFNISGFHKLMHR